MTPSAPAPQRGASDASVLMTDALERLRDWAREQPDATLLLTRGKQYTYRTFLERAAAVADGLVAAGIGRGQRVALLLEEYDQFFLVMTGAWLAGAVVVPLNTTLPPRDVAWLLAKARPETLVVPTDAGGAANLVRRERAKLLLIDRSVNESAGRSVNERTGKGRRFSWRRNSRPSASTWRTAWPR